MKLSFQKFKQNVPSIWANKFSFTILIFLNIYGKTIAELTCHQCRGINCLRTNYNATQKCINSLDICATVFDGQTVVAQGCLEQLSEELRDKCYIDIETDNQDSAILSECFKCNENLCNNLASESFECIQCNSNSDDNCRFKPESFKPTRCLVTRTPNEYCFVKRKGEAIVRGCSYTLEEQIDCLSSEDCMICQASEISGCNAALLSVNGNESGGSSNDNDSEGSTEGGSTSETGGDETNGSNDGGSGSKPGSDGTGDSTEDNSGNEGSNSGSSGSDNESNDNDNNSSQNGNSETGEGSNGSSIAIANSCIIILILNVCNFYVLARK